MCWAPSQANCAHYRESWRQPCKAGSSVSTSLEEGGGLREAQEPPEVLEPGRVQHRPDPKSADSKGPEFTAAPRGGGWYSIEGCIR